MIQEFYGLNQDAFSLTPNLDFLFESGAHEEAVAHLVYGLEQNEDIILLYGDIGTGKTLALQRVVSHVSGSFVPVFLTVTTLDFEQILRLILLKLKVDLPSGVGPAELIYAFEDALTSVRAQGRKVLLVVDEAQNLTVETLESLRLLLNLCQPGSQVLQLVLAGQLGMQATLDAPQLRQLMQRIRVIYRLEMLSRIEVEAYVKHRLRIAGREKPLFKSDALDKIHRLSRGVPRVVNRLASQALLNGYVGGAKSITANLVDDTPQFDDAGAETAPDVVTSPPPVAAPEPPRPAPEPVSAAPDPVVPAPAASAPEAPMARRREPAASSGGKRRRFGPLIAAVIAVAVIAAAYLTYPRWSPVLETLRSPTADVSGAEAGGPATAATDKTVEPTALAVGEEQRASVAVETPAVEVSVPDPEQPPLRTVSDASKATVVNNGETGAEDASAAATRVAPEPVAVAEPDVQPAVRVAETATESPAAAAPEDVLVHVASFRQMDRAHNLRALIQENDVPVILRTVTDRREQVWQRVYLGPFSSRMTAESVATDLKDRGVINFSRILRDPTLTD